MNALKTAIAVMATAAASVTATYHIKDTTVSRANQTVVLADSTNIASLGQFINSQVGKVPYFSYSINTANFKQVVANLDALTGEDTISISTVIAMLMCIYNESGANFTPIPERGTQDYFFESRRLGNGSTKVSYNKIAGNEPAGDYLKRIGVLKDKDSTWQRRWNGVVYPSDAPDTQKKAAENADFSKYAGNGYIQITGRRNYMRCVAPIIPNLEVLTTKELKAAMSQPRIALAAVNNYFRLGRGFTSALVGLESPAPNWDKFGHLVSGVARYHRFADRCQALYEKFKETGFRNILK